MRTDPATLRRRIQPFYYQAYPHAVAARLMGTSLRDARPGITVIAAGVLALVAGPALPLEVSLLWLLAQGLSTAAAIWLNRHYGRPPLMSPAQLRRAEWLSVPVAILQAGAWGLVSQFMVPDADARNLVLLMILLGLGAVTAASELYSPLRLTALGLTACGSFALGLPAIFPDDWPWLVLMVVLHNLLMVWSSVAKTELLAANLALQGEQERLLESQRRETERANQANLDKSAFLAAASHDLRQPLHALMLTSHALGLRTATGEEQQMVERILAAGRALSQQFDQLMDLSRLEGGEYRLQASSFPIARLLQQSFQARRQVAEDKGLRFRLRLNRRLQGLLLHTDPALLARIVDNLLDNAIKYTGTGRGVLLSLRERRGDLWVAVHDQGVGIAPEQLEQVFQPYVQLDNPTRDRSRGVGLGLSIVQGAARLIGAELRLRSQPGRGSVFALRLPGELVRGQISQVPEPLPMSSELLRGKRLLLVEDDDLVAEALRPWLDSWGLRHVRYAEPAQVPADLAPDLIVCDVRLPGGRDGIAWLTEWLTRWPEARGLLMSGELTAAQRAEQEGLMMLAKPADPATLLSALTGMSHD